MRLNVPVMVVLVLSAQAVTAQHMAPSTDARIADTQKKLQQSPGDLPAQNELAGLFLQKMRETADGSYMTRATKLTDAVLKSDPKNYEARRRRLEFQMQLHQFKQAVATAEHLLIERPRDTAVLGLNGDAWMEIGEYDKAADTYQRMVDTRQDLASYNRIAFYRFVTGDAEGALQMMRKAIAMGSPVAENVAWCLSEFGTMLLKTGDRDGAEQAFRKALDTFPGYHRAQAGLGLVLVAKGRPPEGKQHLQAAQATAPFPEYAGALAKIYAAEGNSELMTRQVEMLDVADRLGAAAGEGANRNLSLALADLRHNTNRAVELAEAELAIRQDVYTYDALAWARFRNGQTQGALDAVRKALSQNTPEPTFHEHAAEIYAAAGKTAEAEREQQLASSLNPGYSKLSGALASAKLQ